MPTRQGATVTFGALVALIVGRVFGILELFVIGAAMLVAVVVAVLSVHLLRPRVRFQRWVHPSMLTVGGAGRTDLLISNPSSLPSPSVSLSEPVGTKTTAEIEIGSIRARGEVTAGYRIPADRRGVLTIGPTTMRRGDVLGLAASRRQVIPAEEITVAPATIELAMPSLGSGVLGRHLLSLAQRLGPGEFHSLRDYVDGDEPRSIHWKASARSETLKVRQYESEGVRRCVVVLDTDHTVFDTSDGTNDEPGGETDDALAFERAVSVAASIVTSAARSGLTTRFVAAGVDLRGPHVATDTLTALAPIQVGSSVTEIERDPGEGLGLVFLVTADPSAPVWQRFGRPADPTLTGVGVFARGGGRGPLQVDASTIDSFRIGWGRLTGARAATTTTPEAHRVEVVRR